MVQTILILLVLLILYEIYEHKFFEVSQYEVEVTKKECMPSGIVLCFISDFHNNRYLHNGKRILDKIKKMSPDAVVLAGDMVNKHSRSNKRASEFVNALAETAKVFYSMGNHEEKLRVNQNEIYYNYINSLDSDVVCLDNSDCTEKIACKVRFMGLSLQLPEYKADVLSDETKNIIAKEKDRQEADTLNIMLAHSPEFFEEYEKAGFDLVFSGHIHGGLIRIPGIGGLVSPRLKLPEYTMGVYRINNTQMLVSRGLGSHTIPIRVFNRTEICKVTINIKK